MIFNGKEVKAVKFNGKTARRVMFNGVEVWPKDEPVPDGDPHWENVVALLHFDGSFTDETGKAWTSNNNVTFSELGVFGECAAFGGGPSDYLRYGASADFDFGAGDFTIEFWVKKRTPENQNGGVIDFRVPGASRQNAYILLFSQNTAGQLEFQHDGAIRIASGLVPTDVWTFFAVCKLDGLITMYRDGSAVGTYTHSGAVNGSPPVTIGRVGDNLTYGDYYLRGCIDDVRITKGIARYTENFDPPTEPFPNYGVTP